MNRSEEDEVDKEFQTLQEEIHGKIKQVTGRRRRKQFTKVPNTKPMPEAPSNEIEEHTPQRKQNMNRLPYNQQHNSMSHNTLNKFLHLHTHKIYITILIDKKFA